MCAPRPGYIVPRIQALAMNEAARMVEEGVASAEDIDKAIKYGFGFRFAVLGMLEFIDWGGGDILYYASRYLTQALGSERYAAPEIVERNMREGRIGLQHRARAFSTTRTSTSTPIAASGSRHSSRCWRSLGWPGRRWWTTRTFSVGLIQHFIPRVSPAGLTRGSIASQ